MNAIANRWGPREVWLWSGSALGALLLHLVPATLLVLYIDWTPRLPPPPGSPTEMDVELTAMPSAAPPAASSALQAPSPSQTKQMSAKPTLIVVNPVRPMGAMKPAPQQANADSAANAPPAAPVGAASAPVATSDLGAAASEMTVQLWVAEVKAQLKSHMEYPSDAIQTMQREGVMQDTVTLNFSVDHTGRVTYSHVESEHHYQDLEQETRLMIQLASSLPVPPSLVSSPDTVVTVPVQFQLEFSPTLCSGSNCSTAKAAQSQPHAVPPPRPTLDSCMPAPSPGPAPAGLAATLAQMDTYRDSLNRYLAAAGNQLACLS